MAQWQVTRAERTADDTWTYEVTAGARPARARRDAGMWTVSGDRLTHADQVSIILAVHAGQRLPCTAWAATAGNAYRLDPGILVMSGTVTLAEETAPVRPADGEPGGMPGSDADIMLADMGFCRAGAWTRRAGQWAVPVTGIPGAGEELFSGAGIFPAPGLDGAAPMRHYGECQQGHRNPEEQQ
jgi:hypothetical protein